MISNKSLMLRNRCKTCKGLGAANKMGKMFYRLSLSQFALLCSSLCNNWIKAVILSLIQLVCSVNRSWGFFLKLPHFQKSWVPFSSFEGLWEYCGHVYIFMILKCESEIHGVSLLTSLFWFTFSFLTTNPTVCSQSFFYIYPFLLKS